MASARPPSASTGARLRERRLLRELHGLQQELASSTNVAVAPTYTAAAAAAAAACTAGSSRNGSLDQQQATGAANELLKDYPSPPASPAAVLSAPAESVPSTSPLPQPTPPPTILKADAQNLSRWNVLLAGPPNTPYAGGEYWVVITFGPEYPNKPPSIQFITPSGRFSVGTSLCLRGATSHHSEDWDARVTIVALLSSLCVSMADDSVGGLGSVRASLQERTRYAQASHEWNRRQPTFIDCFGEEEEKEEEEEGGGVKAGEGKTREEAAGEGENDAAAAAAASAGGGTSGPAPVAYVAAYNTGGGDKNEGRGGGGGWILTDASSKNNEEGKEQEKELEQGEKEEQEETEEEVEINDDTKRRAAAAAAHTAAHTAAHAVAHAAALAAALAADGAADDNKPDSVPAAKRTEFRSSSSTRLAEGTILSNWSEMRQTLPCTYDVAATLMYHLDNSFMAAGAPSVSSDAPWAVSFISRNDKSDTVVDTVVAKLRASLEGSDGSSSNGSSSSSESSFDNFGHQWRLLDPPSQLMAAAESRAQCAEHLVEASCQLVRMAKSINQMKANHSYDPARPERDAETMEILVGCLAVHHLKCMLQCHEGSCKGAIMTRGVKRLKTDDTAGDQAKQPANVVTKGVVLEEEEEGEEEGENTNAQGKATITSTGQPDSLSAARDENVGEETIADESGCSIATATDTATIADAEVESTSVMCVECHCAVFNKTAAAHRRCRDSNNCVHSHGRLRKILPPMEMCCQALAEITFSMPLRTRALAEATELFDVMLSVAETAADCSHHRTCEFALWVLQHMYEANVVRTPDEIDKLRICARMTTAIFAKPTLPARLRSLALEQVVTPSAALAALSRCAVSGDALGAAALLDAHGTALAVEVMSRGGPTPLHEAAKEHHADVVLVLAERGWPWKYHASGPSSVGLRAYSPHHLNILTPAEEILQSLATAAADKGGKKREEGKGRGEEEQRGNSTSPAWTPVQLAARAKTVAALRRCFHKPRHADWSATLPPPPPLRGETSNGSLVEDVLAHLEAATRSSTAPQVAPATAAMRTLLDLVLDNHWRALRLCRQPGRLVAAAGTLVLRAARPANPNAPSQLHLIQESRARVEALICTAGVFRDVILAANQNRKADPDILLGLVDAGVVKVLVQLLHVLMAVGFLPTHGLAEGAHVTREMSLASSGYTTELFSQTASDRQYSFALGCVSADGVFPTADFLYEVLQQHVKAPQLEALLGMKKVPIDRRAYLLVIDHHRTTVALLLAAQGLTELTFLRSATCLSMAATNATGVLLRLVECHVRDVLVASAVRVIGNTTHDDPLEWGKGIDAFPLFVPMGAKNTVAGTTCDMALWGLQNLEAGGLLPKRLLRRAAHVAKKVRAVFGPLPHGRDLGQPKVRGWYGRSNVRRCAVMGDAKGLRKLFEIESNGVEQEVRQEAGMTVAESEFTDQASEAKKIHGTALLPSASAAEGAESTTVNSAAKTAAAQMFSSAQTAVAGIDAAVAAHASSPDPAVAIAAVITAAAKYCYSENAFRAFMGRCGLAHFDVHELSSTGDTILSDVMVRGNISVCDAIIVLIEHGASPKHHSGIDRIKGRHHSPRLLPLEPLLDELWKIASTPHPRPLPQHVQQKRLRAIARIRAAFAPPPATDAVLEAAVENVSSSASSNALTTAEEATECFACRELLGSSEFKRVRLHPCGHVHHAECVINWLTTNQATCPTCRQVVANGWQEVPKPPSRPVSVVDMVTTVMDYLCSCSLLSRKIKVKFQQSVDSIENPAVLRQALTSLPAPAPERAVLWCLRVLMDQALSSRERAEQLLRSGDVWYRLSSLFSYHTHLQDSPTVCAYLGYVCVEFTLKLRFGSWVGVFDARTLLEICINCLRRFTELAPADVNYDWYLAAEINARVLLELCPFPRNSRGVRSSRRKRVNLDKMAVCWPKDGIDIVTSIQQRIEPRVDEAEVPEDSARAKLITTIQEVVKLAALLDNNLRLLEMRVAWNPHLSDRSLERVLVAGAELTPEELLVDAEAAAGRAGEEQEEQEEEEQEEDANLLNVCGLNAWVMGAAVAIVATAILHRTLHQNL